MPVFRFISCRLAWTLTGCFLFSPSTSAQYDWRPHIGPRATGFEMVRFGSWDLEILSLRGMIDRQHYEFVTYRGHAVRSISETTYGIGPGGDPTGPAFRRSQATVDRDGRLKRIEYLDPLTRKVIQRETFRYDSVGRLVEWARSRPPSEVAVASLTRTQYPGSPPYGMAQTWSYADDGSLSEWRACTIVTDQRLQDCKEDYLKMDAAGRIVEFGASGTVTSFERDAEGNVTFVRVATLEGVTLHELAVSWDGDVLVEREGDEVAGRTFFDDRGNLVQYRVMSAESPGYYSTVTWTYDGHDRVATVAKAFDSYRLTRDGKGRIVEVDQTVIPRTVRRRYDGAGRLMGQEPPLLFRRMSATAIGSESYEYDDEGLLSRVTVRDSSGAAIARTDFDYARRRSTSTSAARIGR